MSTLNKIRDQFLTVIISTIGITGQGYAQGLSEVGWKGCVKKLIEKKIKGSDYSDIKLIDISNKPQSLGFTTRYTFNGIDPKGNKFNGYIDADVKNIEKVLTEDPRTGARTWDRHVECSVHSQERDAEVYEATFKQMFIDGDEPYFQIRNINNTPLYSETRDVNYVEADHDDG